MFSMVLEGGGRIEVKLVLTGADGAPACFSVGYYPLAAWFTVSGLMGGLGFETASLWPVSGSAEHGGGGGAGPITRATVAK